MAHSIPAEVLARYTAAPSLTTVTGVQRLHESIRDILGSDFETFLQGSYKNDTSIPDLNDVDIVAIRRTVRSGIFQPPSVVQNIVTFESIFDEIQSRLERSAAYRGKTTKNDKCITVSAGFNADVVPAVKIGDDALSDPIAIFSLRMGQERMNHPRLHYDNGVKKHQATSDRYKPTVRMFKLWARNWFGDAETAPSFYLESLVHSFTDASFLPDVAERFIDLASTIVDLNYGDTRVKSVSGDKYILTASEWRQADFDHFKAILRYSLTQAQHAIQAQREVDSVAAWRRAFNQ